MADVKYLINVDFPEISHIHLNPENHDIDTRCQTGIKNPRDGGIVYVTEEEASSYLRHEDVLTFGGKAVENLQKCKLCSGKLEYDLP